MCKFSFPVTTSEYIHILQKSVVYPNQIIQYIYRNVTTT